MRLRRLGGTITSALMVGLHKTLPDGPAPALGQEQVGYGVFGL